MERIECDELVERVTDFLEGTLDTRDRLRISNHLIGCYACEHHIGHVRTAVTLMSRLPTEPVPDELAADLLSRYRDWSASVRL